MDLTVLALNWLQLVTEIAYGRDQQLVFSFCHVCQCRSWKVTIYHWHFSLMVYFLLIIAAVGQKHCFSKRVNFSWIEKKTQCSDWHPCVFKVIGFWMVMKSAHHIEDHVKFQFKQKAWKWQKFEIQGFRPTAALHSHFLLYLKYCFKMVEKKVLTAEWGADMSHCTQHNSLPRSVSIHLVVALEMLWGPNQP